MRKIKTLKLSKKSVIKSKNPQKIKKSHPKQKPENKKKKQKISVKIEEAVVVPVTSSTDGENYPKKRRKRRSSSPGGIYFSQSTEDAIIAYNNEIDQNKREDWYNNHIKYPFEKLVENVFNTFGFSYFEVGPLEVQKETVAHLVANIGKFDPNRINKNGKKCKAFSYFSIIAKNYLIAENNKNYTRFNRHVDIGEEKDDHTVQLQSEDKYHKKTEASEFMKLMMDFWETNIDKIFTKDRDLIIAQAIIELFRQTENIPMFNKKALYLYIREISNCKTNHITRILNKMKPLQVKIRECYVNNGTIPQNLLDFLQKSRYNKKSDK